MKELEALSGKEASFTIGKHLIELKKFSMAVQVWCYQHYATPEEENGIAVLSDKLVKNDIKAILELGFKLVKDKENFPTLKEFAAVFSAYDVFHKLLPNINMTITGSRPDYTPDLKDIEEIKKVPAASVISL